MKKYFVKESEGGYLVQGTLNGHDFDGQGKPFEFSEKDALLLKEAFDYEIEQVKEISVKTFSI